MLIDTHCHLDFSQFDPDRPMVIERAVRENITYMINIGADVPGSQKSVELAAQYPQIFAAVGIHPHYAAEAKEDDIRRIEELSCSAKVVAIGEVGLDYYNREGPGAQVDLSVKEKQLDLLFKFIDLAQKKQLPVIFHCREAADELLSVVKDKMKFPVRAVVHCFSQDKDFLEECLELGMYVSFTANITYPKAGMLREIVAQTPLDRMFLETDAPFLAAQQVRGRRNEPAYLKITADEISRIKKLPVDEVARVTSENARKFFRI